VGFLLAGLLAAFMSNFAATINAAPAYIVNDIYKRFIRPDISGAVEVRLCRIWSLVVLVVGILFGLLATRITDVMMWIVGALYGGYVMANVLKWYWWRFNGYGYFWGMTSGIVSAMFVPRLADWIFGPGLNPLYCFPVIFGISVIGCLLGALLSEPEDEAILKRFYKTVNPWGFWGPIRRQVELEDPAFRPNRNCARDSVNVAVGIVWQLCLTVLPIYLVLRRWRWAGAIAATFLAGTIFLKFNWYDRLEKAPAAEAGRPRPLAAGATLP
jgi:SSS family solute:Na+ symporter